MSEPRRVGLTELLRTSVGAQFVIPVYQRPYSWKRANCELLIKDLKEVDKTFNSDLDTITSLLTKKGK